jgi:hypothetical protein
MPVLDPSLVQLILLILLASLYLPIMLFAVQRLEEQASAARLVILYAVLALIIGVFEALWRGGKIDISEGVFLNVQGDGALALSFLMLLEAYIFLRRTIWQPWRGNLACVGLGGVHGRRGACNLYFIPPNTPTALSKPPFVLVPHFYSYPDQ